MDWLFDGGHVASRFISVKPKTANSSTDIHMVSDHGNEYTLELREISSDADGQAATRRGGGGRRPRLKPDEETSSRRPDFQNGFLSPFSGQ